MKTYNLLRTAAWLAVMVSAILLQTALL